MILDIADQLASAYAPTAIAANTNGTYIDRMVAMDDGMGETIIFYGRVATTATSAGAATVNFILQGDPTDPAFGAAVTVTSTGAIPVATLVAGYEFKLKVPRGFTERYFRLVATIATATLTAGAFDAYLTNDDMQDNKAYAAGYTVL